MKATCENTTFDEDRGLYLKEYLGHGKVLKDAFACLQAQEREITGSAR